MKAMAPTTVLIVDDHGGFRVRVRRMLESEGYEVVGEAADGAACIDAVPRLRPDLVLLDLQLPDQSGFEVAAQLARAAAPPAVVVVSTRDAADFADLAQRHGARGFVAKAELSAAALDALLA
jgi:DNA-binding NarL/FixJ family response regulator